MALMSQVLAGLTGVVVVDPGAALVVARGAVVAVVDFVAALAAVAPGQGLNAKAEKVTAVTAAPVVRVVRRVIAANGAEPGRRENARVRW